MTAITPTNTVVSIVATAPLTAHTFANPTTYVNGSYTDPDPFVLRFRGRYYCYSTDEHQVNVSVSDDLVTWSRIGAALARSERSHFWAPCVIYVDGTFYMYFSDRPAGSTDPHDERLQLATSSTPDGPFTVLHRFLDTFAIDPHVVPDGAGGLVMFYATNDVTGLDDAFVGTSIVADRLIGFDRLAGERQVVVRPSLDEEIFERNRFGDGRDWYTVEGATYVTRGAMAYLTYSGNAYEREDYFIGYASAALTDRPDRLAWQKYPSPHEWSPLVRRSDAVEGTGHNSIVRAPNLVDDWIVYHGRDAATELKPGIEQRVMRIDALRYDSARLITDAPTHTAQDAPALATVYDAFTTPLSDAWVLASGSASSHDRALRTSPDAITHLVTTHRSDAYVMEVHARAARTDRGARIGVIVAWTDAQNFTEVTADAGTDTVTARQWRGGVATTVATVPLVRTDCTVWQPITVRRSFDVVTVHWAHAGALSVTVPSGPARVGLSSHRTAAHFSGFALTDHVDLAGPELARIGERLTTPDAVVATDGALSPVGRESAALTGSRGTHETSTYAMHIVAPGATATVTPWCDEQGQSISVKFTRGGYRIDVSSGTATSSVVTVDHPKEEPNPTLIATISGMRVALYVGPHRHDFTIPTSPQARQRLELSGAHLTAFSQTTVNNSIYQQSFAKEQE